MLNISRTAIRDQSLFHLQELADKKWQSTLLLNKETSEDRTLLIKLVMVVNSQNKMLANLLGLGRLLIKKGN